jgi:uroporphyrinogen-III synthase
VPAGFDGLRVLALESRRATEIAELIRRHGGEPVSAPSMREIPLEENEQALAFARRLAAGEIEVVVLLTGVGTRTLAAAIEKVLARDAFAEELRKRTIVARGPKPVAALRELGVTATVTVPEPNTWRDLLAAVDGRLDLSGKTVAVQEYGEENAELIAGFEARGASVVRVPVYRWALPEDLGPLRAGIERVIAGTIDVLLVTSATQLEHLFRVAGAERAEALTRALRRIVIASIGPIASEALARRGLRADLEPSPPKMGPLVRVAAEQAASVLAGKTGAKGSGSGSGISSR